MCCTQSLKIYDATNRHLGTIAELCEAISSQLRYVWTIGKRNCLTTIPPPYNTMKFGPVVAQIDLRVWNMPANCNKFRVLAALLHGTLLVGVSWTLRCWTQGATYTRQSGHDVGPWPTFIVINNLQYIFLRNILLSLCNWLLNAFGSAEVVFKKYMDILHFMAACVADVDIIFSSCAFFVLHSFLLALSQPSHSQIGCLPYLHTWCGFTVNVQWRCEMCCTWLGENTGCKKVAKNPHLGSMAQLRGAIFSQVKARIDNPKKKISSQNMSSTFSQYGELWRTSGCDHFLTLGTCN